MHLVERCVFIPFLRAQAGDFIQEAQDAEAKGASGDAHHARKFAVVCYDDPGKPLKDFGVSLTTRILIAGHGQPGRPYISNTSGQGRKEYLPYNVVCDRLIEKGLRKRYCGAISCDVCYSAVANSNNPSFADLVSRYLNHKGYILLHTIGYMGPMNAVHEAMAGKHKYEHRVVDVMKGGAQKTIKTADWAAWKHYSGIWSVPSHLKNLNAAYDTCPPY